ncbi:hypothetical protein Cgig2_015835 [Carnegiea gigantea]|uniref:Uncharacterized protein n=1 Tax=Carnegiea gigantea TaxID=171969 RepID=A0A9Q1QIS1_9CARY|nr:hypothetical protein Cgig2_015835 [Carnegiea gigantea]
MAGPSRRMSTTQTSGGSGSSWSDLDNNAKYYYNCGYVVVMYETDDNYRRRHLVCSLENESACQYLAVVDPDYPKQARDVIDQLTEELGEMEFFDPLASDASSPLQGPHVGPRGKVICGTVFPIVWECGKPAEIVVDPHVPCMRRVVCQQRMCGHDVWLKRSRTRHDKAIIIRRLQASVNKLKATLLEKGHVVRASE